MSTILHATDAAELLGLVPSLAGFTPRQSLVLLPFRGRRTHGALRVDLPDPDVDPDEFADAAIELVDRIGGVDALALVVYTDEEPLSTPDGPLLPQLALAESLLDAADDAALRIVEALCVTPGGWGDYRDDEPELHPLDGIPTAPAVPGVGDVSGDQLAGAALPPSDLAETERVGRALADLCTVLQRERRGAWVPGPEENPQALAAAVMLDDVPAFAEAVLESPDDLPPFACAALLWCLNRPVFRDAIIVQWATDAAFGTRALAAQLAFADAGSTVPDDVGEVFLGRGARPDPDRLGCALSVARRAATCAPRAARPGALVAAAWLAWALGRSSHAAEYLRQALEIDPQHSMASLLRTVLAAAMLPEWTLRRA
ncbi:DUF4192 family protein [Microbacterium sp. EF45047]|uniref:DUF4192 family protein n=1 Tax=Microbacterium sp. EF45047 TaxID=2809708 RepID=UPI00234BD254|nr:DUF4192 family protein [Microbacterium sp. EF45047]WCM55931.1 DUF4192 family protein [Microbacterium sp. EF45047]